MELVDVRRQCMSEAIRVRQTRNDTLGLHMNHDVDSFARFVIGGQHQRNKLERVSSLCKRGWVCEREAIYVVRLAIHNRRIYCLYNWCIIVFVQYVKAASIK